MTFQAPLFLLALLLLPVALAVYLRVERRRSSAAESFASAPTMPSVAPRRPAWRRHAPMAAYAAALAVLAIAFARPEATVAVPEEQASVVLLTDQSGSMGATDVSPSRLEAARAAAADFLDDAPDELRVGAVVFNHGITAVEAPTTDRGQVRAALDRMRPSGGTASGDALASALALLERRRGEDGRRAPAAIILLSDGASTSGREPLEAGREAAREGIPVHTVALGTETGTIEVRTRSGGTERRPVPPDRETLARLASLTGGRPFDVEDADQLGDVYERLGSQVAMREERREITAAFAAGGGLLLLTGGLMALGWFGRLP